jgi:carbonic anhydrase
LRQLNFKFLLKLIFNLNIFIDINFNLKIQLSDKDNSNFEPVIKTIDSILQPNSSTTFDFDLFRLIDPQFNKYYSYNGSVTSPPCTENVDWNVAIDQKVFISKRQILMLTRILDTQGNRVTSFI